MKVSGSIEERFRQQQEYADAIKAKLNSVINDWCRLQGWFYEDRIKGLESYAQKIEQSRNFIIDDVYAGTIVVKNKNEIKECCELLRQRNPIGIRYTSQRPPSLNETRVDPARFDFDSVRMYFKPPLPDIDPPPYVNEIFEIQVKTLLEQAWDKATHSTYKSEEDLSWAKNRLIAQAKAILESAEIALAETDLLSRTDSLQKSYSRMDDINKISAFYRENWEPDQLPKNLRRLSENSSDFLLLIGKDLSWIKNLIEEENKAGRGSHLINLAPYWIIVQASIRKIGWTQFIQLLQENDHRLKGKKFPIIRELEFDEMHKIDSKTPICII